ncbi:deoxyribonuclease IV [Pelobacter propionicus]|uniref:Probable endonuclease 4 n=1 Tax=Pelobacter propionicus (strain DSM 2379 / NBRC 103807 / OttBd1) TaxID=338966 RepID=A1AL65_PELPD|nr:deoxyribonuclease IV [Pelobacter propionicus]ABK98085.1 Endonuclease IV [Pelobacter propionicus DSM 2379]
MPDYLGAHMSIAGGLHRAIDRAMATGCGVLQIFTRNSNQWKEKTLSDADVALFREKFAASGLREVISHDIYLINLASAPGEVRDKSLAAFRDELETCARLGIDRVVMHPGSHLSDSPEAALTRVSQAFDRLFQEVPLFQGRVLLETTAGQGTNLGRNFQELRTIIDGCRYPERFGVCFDTCHTFAAGYDITSEEGYRSTKEEFDQIIGLDRLECFHFNDSRKGLGSRVDRHEHIGQGMLGLNPFRFILNDQRFATTPKILETPKGDNDEMDGINLGLLRGLVT